MTLKEAFTYQNYLSNELSNVKTYLRDSAYTIKTKRVHKKSKANKEAEDITEEVVEKKQYDCTADELLNLLSKIVIEKELCTNAITKTKNSLPEDIDALIANNKTIQETLHTLNSLATQKSVQIETRGTAYCFNNEGNQIPYYYDIEESTSIDYNRNKVKDMIKEYTLKVQENSKKVDEYMITAEVNFTPQWEITDDFEDMINSVKS